MKFSTALLFGLASASTRYIVKIKTPEGLHKRDDQALDLNWAKDILSKHSGDSLVEETPIYSEFNFNGFQGFAVETTEDAALEFYGHENVDHISIDRPLTLNSPVPHAKRAPAAAASWGIDRIDQRSLPLDKNYKDVAGQGEGITVYVIDTGILDTHSEFEGRAKQGPGFVNGVYSATSPDENGHGTHCAGTIGSKTYGVAKKANIVGLKIFDQRGGGDSGVIAAIEWIAKNAIPGKSVVSMSIGTDLRNCVQTQTNPTQEVCNNPAMKAALRAAAELNIPFAVAAGNDSSDACRVAPASEPMAYTVASSTSSDSLSSFSNRGSCVDIIAPGSSITSTWNNGRTNTISGTSMACPHVSGAMAVLLSQRSFSNVQAVYDAITELSTKGAIKSIPSETVNNLLYIQ
jgi:serine protease